MLDSTTSQKVLNYRNLSSQNKNFKIMRLKEVKEVTQKPINKIQQHFDRVIIQAISSSQFNRIPGIITIDKQENNINIIRNQHQQRTRQKNQLVEVQRKSKRIEQALNKQKFNHCLENNQQSITRRRVQRLSSETSTQSKFFIESRPTSKQGTQLQNQVIFDSMQKKQSIKAASTQHQSQIDQYDYEISQQPINFDTLVNKILDKKQEQQSQNDENEEENLEEEEEEFEEYKDEKDIMKIKTEGIYEQIENNQIIIQEDNQKQVIKQDNLYNQQVVTANKQTIQKLQQTKSQKLLQNNNYNFRVINKKQIYSNNNNKFNYLKMKSSPKPFLLKTNDEKAKTK